MPSVFGNAGASAGEVNDFHANSDVDKSTLSQHHTLGIQPNQASPGDHDHNGRNSKRLKLSNLEGTSITYSSAGGTTGAGATQPTFSGAPMIVASYTKLGNLVHFQIAVEFDNITSFGTGQYYLTLPFAADHPYHFRDGCLHDFSTGDQYAISGHVVTGSSQLLLSATASNGRDVPFTHNVPVTLAIQDNFHIAGTYEMAQ